MKKINIVGIISLIMLITACTSTGGTVTANSGDELDTAVREASNYLNTRIPNGNKVAFINISGGYPDLADYILSDLSKHGVNDGRFSVVDRAQLDQVRAELNFNMSGEVSEQSAQEIGQMLGAQTIVSGSVRKIGALYRLDIKAIEVQTAAVQGQWNKNIPDGMTIAALTETAGGGTATTTASGGTASTGSTTAAAAPAAIANGTYTFWPRPRAMRAGVDEDCYVDRIVVRSGYFTVYITKANNTVGWSNNWNHNWASRCKIQDLDQPSKSYSGVRSGREDRDTRNFFSFANVTSRRFKMYFEWENPPSVFEEINLDDATFEP